MWYYSVFLLYCTYSACLYFLFSSLPFSFFSPLFSFALLAQDECTPLGYYVLFCVKSAGLHLERPLAGTMQSITFGAEKKSI
jgi:hypothetical protein